MDEEGLTANFKSAALAVTQLFKESQKQRQRAFEAGYLQCLQELSDYILHSSTLPSHSNLIHQQRNTSEPSLQEAQCRRVAVSDLEAFIQYICSDEESEDNTKFFKENGIKLVHYRIKGNKEPFGEIEQSDIADALVHVLDRRNHPMLIHCNKGKHRIGCLVGCLRKLQNWSLTSIFDEYRRFAGAKIRIADQEFIEIFEAPIAFDPNYVPKWFT
ncbi:hypothetical protein HDU97_002696 [Phlyctochytrium planicorne]|nr:hypothetical protein HDU97_002696 [Phlyctochytrium planicorne]